VEIDLHSELSFRNSFLYPIQTKLARRELVIGAILVLLPLIGWLLNMGHRVEMVHNMHHGREAWPSWQNYPRLLKSGTVTFLGMVYYYVPGIIVAWVGLKYHQPFFYVLALFLALAATIAIPGYMTHYCHDFDAEEIFNPFRALHRVFEGGAAYWKAWAIAVAALVLSFLGLLVLGIGFLFTSVWFWQVAGFSFASVFSKQFKLTTVPAYKSPARQ
jgi:hypothetical protein